MADVNQVSRILQVAAGNGTSAMVTKDGDLYIFGKDSSQSDYSTGQVNELKGQIVTQVLPTKRFAIEMAYSMFRTLLKGLLKIEANLM